MNIQELKKKSSEQLISQAEELGVENASTLRKQEILFAILKKLAEKGEEITGIGVLQLLQDGFGFLRAIESNYLPGPDDIYISPNQIRRFGLRTGDTIEVKVKVTEGERTRLQAFEGLVISKKNRGINSSFIVRKISNGVGVERTFQTHSPLIGSIKVKRKGLVKQSKLYYIRERSGKSARIKEKIT